MPIPEEVGISDEAEDAVEAELVRALTESGDLTGVSWELLSTTGEAGSELVRIAEDRDAACVVVGKRHSGFGEFLHRIASGSVSRASWPGRSFPCSWCPDPSLPVVPARSAGEGTLSRPGTPVTPAGFRRSGRRLAVSDVGGT